MSTPKLVGGSPVEDGTHLTERSVQFCSTDIIGGPGAVLESNMEVFQSKHISSNKMPSYSIANVRIAHSYVISHAQKVIL